MKKLFPSVFIVLMVLISSCQKEVTKQSDLLLGSGWELEAISNTDKSFEELFPGKKPYLEFDQEGSVKGNSGCNGYTSEYKISENQMSFGEPGPTTMMYCGEGENMFRDALKKITHYEVDDEGKLKLVSESETLLIFKASDLENDANETSVNVRFNKQEITDKSYFKANGTEPFWGLEIDEQSITLKMMEDTITVPNPKSIKAMDANVKQYDVETEAYALKIVIIQDPCENQMSGEKFPYSVKMELKSTGDSEIRPLHGCGYYMTDPKLNNIWTLEEMNGNPIDRSQYPNKLPSIIIDSEKNIFIGHTGCNDMKGSLFFEPNLLRFKDIITTKKMCVPDNGQEQAFLQALKSSITFKVDNDRLTLSNPNGELLMFRKDN